jgi:hypothetical protein
MTKTDIARMFPSVAADEHAVFMFETYSPQLLRRRVAAKPAAKARVGPQHSFHVFRKDGSLLMLRKSDIEFLR